MAESIIKAVGKPLKTIYFSGTTDSNGNIYDSTLNTTDHQIVETLASGDKACTPMINGSGSGYNYHISDYTNWNVGSGRNVTVWVIYFDK